jgi:hypothetical protein
MKTTDTTCLFCNGSGDMYPVDYGDCEKLILGEAVPCEMCGGTGLVPLEIDEKKIRAHDKVQSKRKRKL